MPVLDEFLRKIPPEQQSLVKLLDSIISKAIPTLTATLKWGNLTYHNGKKNVCAIVSHKYHINLQIWNGARLNDPRGLLTGTGKNMRHVKIADEDDLDQEYITDLIKQATLIGDN